MNANFIFINSYYWIKDINSYQMSFAKLGGACKQERILCFKRAGNTYCNNFIKHISETLSLNFLDIFMKLNLFILPYSHPNIIKSSLNENEL